MTVLLSNKLDKDIEGKREHVRLKPVLICSRDRHLVFVNTTPCNMTKLCEPYLTLSEERLVRAVSKGAVAMTILLLCCYNNIIHFPASTYCTYHTPYTPLAATLYMSAAKTTFAFKSGPCREPLLTKAEC